MRLRNVKGAQDIIENCPYVIQNPNSYKGHFQDVFQNDHVIEIEIGMGKGDFIIGKALENPHINFIGIEKYPSVLVRAVQKIEQEIPNLKLIAMDAIEIDKIFEREIHKIYLNFSDPWPKKRHALRRLTSPIFLEKYTSIFEGDYQIEMKTDNPSLFAYSLMTLSQAGYIYSYVTLDLWKEDIPNIPTEYEMKFGSQGMPIYKLVAKRQANDKQNKKA